MYRAVNVIVILQSNLVRGQNYPLKVDDSTGERLKMKCFSGDQTTSESFLQQQEVGNY